MGYTASPPLRKQVDRILKQAADEASCPKCGMKMSKGACPCGYKKGSEGEQEKESMGVNPSVGAGYDTGMDVTASADTFPNQLSKLAGVLRYSSEHFYDLVDDRSDQEKVAELMAFSQKLAMEEPPLQSHGSLVTTLENDANTKKEQATPHRGKKMVPNETPTTAMGELENNMNDDRTSEEWTDSPLSNKKAHVLKHAFRSVMQKRAQGMGMGMPAPAPAPGGAPPPAAGGAMPPGGAPAPMPAGPPPPPPGPDPRMIAQQLMAQGSLTPEALAQAAGISPEEAAAVIAAMTGGTGAPPPARYWLFCCEIELSSIVIALSRAVSARAYQLEFTKVSRVEPASLRS